MRPLELRSTMAANFFIHSCCASLSVLVPSFMTFCASAAGICTPAARAPRSAIANNRCSFMNPRCSLFRLVLLHCELGLLDQRKGRPCIARELADGTQVALARKHHMPVTLMQDCD